MEEAARRGCRYIILIGKIRRSVAEFPPQAGLSVPLRRAIYTPRQHFIRYPMETNAAKAGCQAGVIAMLQTYGSRLNFNPHLHMLVPTQVVDPEQSQTEHLSHRLARGHKSQTQ